MSPVENLFWNSKKRIEASVGFLPSEDDSGYLWDIRPAETMYGGPIGEAMKLVDAASLHLQRRAQSMLGIALPDIRFRIITTGPDEDGCAGTHFGTLAEAIKLGQRRFDERFGIINGTVTRTELSELPAPNRDS